MSKIDELQQEAVRLIEEASDSTFMEMLFTWHGVEYLVDGLLESIKNHEGCHNLEVFISKFRKEKEE